jgi:SNF2 family DNA or RNA helicase
MLTELYKLSGIAKIKGIINYLTELLDNAHIKIIVFAHHRAVLDGIEGSIKKQVGYMRIDGRVSA